MHVRYIVWHTAAAPRDVSAAEIHRWHKARDFDLIGYHYVIRKDGTVEHGRPDYMPGAHVRGLNARSLGICFSGHGDEEPLTPAQKRAGVRLTRRLLQQYGLGPDALIGHREINDLIDAGRVKLSDSYRTFKSCPGKMIDMNIYRNAL